MVPQPRPAIKTQGCPLKRMHSIRIEVSGENQPRRVTRPAQSLTAIDLRASVQKYNATTALSTRPHYFISVNIDAELSYNRATRRYPRVNEAARWSAIQQVYRPQTSVAALSGSSLAVLNTKHTRLAYWACPSGVPPCFTKS